MKDIGLFRLQFIRVSVFGLLIKMPKRFDFAFDIYEVSVAAWSLISAVVHRFDVTSSYNYDCRRKRWGEGGRQRFLIDYSRGFPRFLNK